MTFQQPTTSEQQKLQEIFMPVATKKINEYKKECKEKTENECLYFAHYTSAESAMGILESKCIWMRNTNCMSDYREIHHGTEAIDLFLKSQDCQNFIKALESCDQNDAAEEINNYQLTKNDIRTQTYITSISEHDKTTEDEYGRLSMWRAYGNSTGVAIVIKINYDSLYAPYVLFSPVAYLTNQQVIESTKEIINNIVENRDFLKSVDSLAVQRFIRSMFIAAATCLKHPGFTEEKEWRIVYSPAVFGNNIMEEQIATIRNTPQKIFQFPFSNDLSLPNIIDRIIIGPSQYHEPLHDAFSVILQRLSIQNPKARIIRSEIPIRT